jgi:hypothetical protein
VLRLDGTGVLMGGAVGAVIQASGDSIHPSIKVLIVGVLVCILVAIFMVRRSNGRIKVGIRVAGVLQFALPIEFLLGGIHAAGVLAFVEGAKSVGALGEVVLVLIVGVTVCARRKGFENVVLRDGALFIGSEIVGIRLAGVLV